jgi:phage anti-repressor protein
MKIFLNKKNHCNKIDSIEYKNCQKSDKQIGNFILMEFELSIDISRDFILFYFDCVRSFRRY